MNRNIVWMDDIGQLTVIHEDVFKLLQHRDTPFIVSSQTTVRLEVSIEPIQVINKQKMILSISEELPLGVPLELIWGNEKLPIFAGAIVRTAWFEENFSSPNVRLGAYCTNESTQFAIWAPTATAVKLYLDNNIFSFNRQKNGVWKLNIYGDWHGYNYEYAVTVNGNTNRVIDPYTKGLLANSEKGVIIDFSRTHPVNRQDNHRRKTDLQDAIIYELHVRDATIHPDSGVEHKGKYIGLSELGTKTKAGFSTALTYLTELGITHVQLLPVNDFARVDERKPEKEYNWGYDPLFYQVPEGSYSTRPDHPTARIEEFKQLVDAFHAAEISVILDVVYNHVYIMEESSFEKIVPGYYFRYHHDGSISNGTGVGNDIATERIMARKFIIDTIDHWLTQYQVDGFRFDLMGIMDVETLKQIKERCDKEDRPIMLLGEGWELDTALAPEHKATSNQSHQLPGIRFFNDYFRDSLKGQLFDLQDRGYVNGCGHHIERLRHLVSGSVLEEYGTPFVKDVTQTINYVECHDNHTLWDRLSNTNPDASESDRKKMQEIATGLTLLSQGVPFLHAGQEWFRTKFGDENSYLSGDSINQLDWIKREQEVNTIRFVKKLITLRKTHQIFRLKNKQDIRRRLHIIEAPPPIFGFALLGDDEDFTIFVNPTNQLSHIRLPSSGTWSVAVTNHVKKSKEQMILKGEYTTIEPYEFIMFKKSRI